MPAMIRNALAQISLMRVGHNHKQIKRRIGREADRRYALRPRRGHAPVDDQDVFVPVSPPRPATITRPRASTIIAAGRGVIDTLRTFAPVAGLSSTTAPPSYRLTNNLPGRISRPNGAPPTCCVQATLRSGSVTA